MDVIKRNNTVQEFDRKKITRAITHAMREVDELDEKLANRIAKEVEKDFKDKEQVNINEIQELVEEKLMQTSPSVARAYIIYRNKQDEQRGKLINRYKYLSEDFLSEYKHRKSPMGPLGNFVYYRTYSRWLPEAKRREEWWETVARAVDYNCGLVPNTTVEEAEKLFDNVYNLRQFLSGRTFWSGGTKAAELYPLSNFNCSFITIDNIQKFYELNYLLMCGCGVGASLEDKYTSQLPKFRTGITVISESVNTKDKHNRSDLTTIENVDGMPNDAVRISVGDSKEGWSQAIKDFMEIYTSQTYKTIKFVLLNYDNIRPKGARLKTFGGYAPGPDGLIKMFEKLYKTIERSALEQNIKSGNKVKLRPVDVLDFCNIISQSIVAGGIRRSAQILLMDSTDKQSAEAKSNLYYQDDSGNWVSNDELLHRMMSNNSINYWEKPTREEWHNQIQTMRYTGEPGFFNAKAAKKRNPYFKGTNPCAA